MQVIARSGDVASEPVRITVKAIAQRQEAQRIKQAQPSKNNIKRLANTAKGAQSKEHVRMARLHRERGEYAQAFAELEKAGEIDPRNPEVQGEMAITRRACMAERTLGRSELNC